MSKTPRWWRHLRPAELRFAENYIVWRKHVAQMQKQYRNLYFRAWQRMKRK